MKPGVVARNAVGDAFVFFRLARTGRVNQPAAWRDALGRVLQHRELGGGERRQVGSLPPPADVGIAPQRAEPRARRVDQHAVEAVARTAAAAADRPARCGRWWRRWRATVSAQQLDAAIADIARDQQPRPSIARRSPSSCRPATRRYRARARTGRSPASSVTSCDASSCTTNSPRLRPSPRSGWPSSTIRPSGANAVGCGRDVVGGERRGQLPRASVAAGWRAA